MGLRIADKNKIALIQPITAVKFGIYWFWSPMRVQAVWSNHHSLLTTLEKSKNILL